MRSKRVRIFAGPNGSGKSSLFQEFCKIHSTGPFVNADIIENMLISKGLVDLKDFGLKAKQKDLILFSKLPSSLSLIKKAELENRPIDVTIAENCIVDRSKESHSYEASFVASFIRHLLISQDYLLVLKL